MNDKINNYINTHPRECLYLSVISISLIWQTIPGVLGVILYLILIRKFQVSRIIIVSLSLFVLMAGIYFQQKNVNSALSDYLKLGFQGNKVFWKNILLQEYSQSIQVFYYSSVLYVLSVPLAITSLLGLIDLVPEQAHAATLKALKKGVLHPVRKELSEKVVNVLLEEIPDVISDASVLGVSTYTGSIVVVPDKHLNQVALVLGTTGGGKTITLRRFYDHAINEGHPLIIVDGKPDDSNVKWLIDRTEKNQRPFYGFNCGNYKNYDPLADGGYTELKDKIISLKDQWENDYYRSIAEDYLQTTFEVLLKENKQIDLKKVVKCLNYADLQNLVRQLKNDELSKRVESLEQYNRSDITGLQAHLNILIHSELGQYFQNNDSSFRLKQVIEQNGIVYFALPALRFPSFSKVLGKLVINDLKAVIDRYDCHNKKIFSVFDEFSMFAGEQVLNLVNMGRAKGVHALFGTQGLADLDKVDATFKAQVLNCANTIICHRLNDDQSAEAISTWAGTMDGFNVTGQLNMQESDAALGSVRIDQNFIIHPNEIKQNLRIGEAFYITKVGKFQWDKIKVKYS